MLTRRRLYWSAALLLTSGVLLAAAQAVATLPADLDPQSRARLPYLQRKDLSGFYAIAVDERMPPGRPDLR